MQARSSLVSFARWAAVVAASAGIFVAATLVSGHVAVKEIAALPKTTVAIKRPSYLSPLPELTAREINAGRIEAAAVAPESPPGADAATLAVASTPAPEVVAPTRPSFLVTANGLNVRAAPTSSSEKLFVLRHGERIEVAESEGNWMRVMSASGESGWAFSRYLAPVQDQ